MSQENVEIVRSIYDAWARNDFPGPAHLLDAQILYVNPPEAIEPGIRYGLGAFSRAVEQVFHGGGWESWRIEPERFTPFGDRVAVELRYRARGRGSGVEVEGRMSALWTLRDGKVVRFEWFLAPTGALEAVGLAG
jgi:ketosteroid isomerase-like protein